MSLESLTGQAQQRSAFEQLVTVEPTPITNVSFSYHLHTDLVTTRLNGGSASIDANRLKLSTGAGANQSAQLFTNVPVKYYAGIGIEVEFAVFFTVTNNSTGVANSTQIVGIGDSGDGLFFGLDGTDFGVLRRHGGNPEIHSIQITTKSTTTENITITLDGDSDSTIAVTDATSGNATTTVNDIVSSANQTKFAALGRGWKAVANGDTVNFISFESAVKTGSYSISGTTVVGSASAKLAGVAQIDTWKVQTSWTYDKATGNESLPLIDFAKGNVFKIVFGWLGFDAISFFIKHPATKEWVLVHIIEYGNANLLPSLNSPTLPVCALVENSSNTSDVLIMSGSMGGFIQGKQPPAKIKHVAILNKTFPDATVIPAITIHNNGIFQNKLNRIRIKITNVSVTVESGKPIVMRIIKGAVLTGASFSDHDSDRSVVAIDTTATAVANGEILAAFPVSTERDKKLDLFIEPTEFFTLAGAQGAAGADSITQIVIDWEEDH